MAPQTQNRAMPLSRWPKTFPRRAGARLIEGAMAAYPVSPYIDERHGGLYIAGTRIGLDVVAYDFWNGRSAEAIFDAYPSVGSLAKVCGAITFILEHPKEVEAYLAGQDRRYEEIQARYPLTPDMVARFEGVRRGRRSRS